MNPDEAFFPLRRSPDGSVQVSFQYENCVKRFIVCTKWEKKTVFFPDLEWFLANNYVLMKMPDIK